MSDRIVIVGGGPAGATLALRLARLGHATTVVERSAAPRAVDGESLHPGIWPLFDALGLEDCGGLRVHRSLVRWSSDGVVVRHHRVPQLAVLRSSFDARLLERVRAAGGEIARSPLEIARSPVVVDATGRASWSRPPRTRTSEPMLAMRGTWRGAGLPREARVESVAEGWIWGSPMPGGTFAAIACVDAPADYRELLRKSLLFRELRGEVSVHTCDATTYAADTACDERVLRVGDASHSLDPLSSGGVRSAMQSALHASVVLNTILRHPARAALARRFYEQTQRAAVAEHAAWTRAFYAESRFRDLPFWRKRAAASPPARDLARDAPLALARDVAIGEVPCIMGDVIEPRRGVTGTARPFVWIGGIEAARLLDPLARGAMTAGELFARWRGIAPAGREPELLEGLVRSGVIGAMT